MAISNVKEPKNIESLTFMAHFPVIEMSKLKEGDQLSPTSVSLAMMFSSSSNDWMDFNLKTNSGVLYVRSVDSNTITIYLDHLKFDCYGGSYLAKGEYVLYGDVKFTRK